MCNNGVADGLILALCTGLTLSPLDALQVLSGIVELLLDSLIETIIRLVGIEDLILCVETCDSLEFSITV
jgi:hypothetical protein